MNSVEDRLRAATQAAAQAVIPGSAPPLRLPDRQPRRLGSPERPPWPGRHWRRLAIPLGAAAAVAALVISSVAVGHQQRPTVSHAAADALAQLPPYFLTTGQVPDARHAWIAATATGQAVAQVPVPAGDFVAYTAASGHGTFALATLPQADRQEAGSYAVQGLRLFLVRFRPGSGRVTETPLTALTAALRATGSRSLSYGIALSPNGRELAVALAASKGVPRDQAGRPGIMLADLSSGKIRSWAWPVQGNDVDRVMGGWPDGQPMSWASDSRALAVQIWISGSLEVRVLNTRAPGDDLRSASAPAMGFPDSLNWLPVHHRLYVSAGGAAVLTPDGSRLVLATLSMVLQHTAQDDERPVRVQIGFTEFSARTGRQLAIRGAWHPRGGPAEIPDVFWSSPAGRVLVVLTRAPGAPVSYAQFPTIGRGPLLTTSAHYRQAVAVLHDGQLTKLPVPVGRLGQRPDDGRVCSPVW